MKVKQSNGISLIVLVITIIVMIILAGAIILALNSSNIVGRAEEAKRLSDDANKRQAAEVLLGEYMLEKELNNITESAEEYVITNLINQGINTDNLAVVGNKVIVGSGASFIKKQGEGENDLKIGDYVEYTPEIKTSTKYKMFDDYNWEETTAFVTEAGIKWRYMGIDASGNALLVADRTTTGKLYLEGASGYLQGPTKLNDLCKELYSSAKGEARSINVEDVNKTLEAKPKLYFYNSNYDYVEIPSPKTIGQIRTEYSQPALTYTETPDGKDINNYLVNYYWYQGTTTPKGSGTPEYKLMFKEGNVTTDMYYWLASSCVYAYFDDGYAYFDDGYAYFYVRCVNGGYVDTYYMFGSNGYSNNDYYAVRPVVSLKSNVQIGEKIGEVWKLK
ncbi:MAG: hypothetical protein PHR25_00865 [Clostridia bacterium]|nr:hypothetical protein [Clostridia bacterium]